MVHHNAKLASADIQQIRATYTGKRGELAALARHFKVTNRTIVGVLSGRTWAHLAPAPAPPLNLSPLPRGCRRSANGTATRS